MTTPTAFAGPPRPLMMTTLAEDKSALRKAMRAVRAREARQMPKAGEALAFRFPPPLLDGRFKVVAGYAPMHDEIEAGGAFYRLRQTGARLCLPAVVERRAPLVFRDWDYGRPLEPDAVGALAPPADAETLTPDLVLVPCLAFDQQGGRLGYGGGYYDRTLAKLRAEGEVVAIGLAYEVSRVEALPMEPNDQRLDWILTEAAAYEVFASAGA